jgi:acyl-coenzyme A thioesterase 9
MKNPIVSSLWASREAAKKMIGSGAYSLEPKSPAESKVEVSYPFSQDEVLRSTYENPWGQLRFGRVLEDLDALAGNISFLHVGSPSPVIVTASVDRIVLRKRPHISHDQSLSGQVTWTGTSSMEIRMQYESEGEVWLVAHVTFVVLDRETHRPTKIPPLLPQTDLERKYFAEGAKRAAQKKALRKAHKTPHASEEVEIKARELLQKAAPLLNMPSLADPFAILQNKTQ